MKHPLVHPVAIAATLFPLFAMPGRAADADSVRSHTAPYPAFGEIKRLDPALDALIAPDARMEALATGFTWSEGPTWHPREDCLLFSDVPENTVYRWREGRGIDVFLHPSGFTGAVYNGRESGSNGLAVDAEGRLVLCQHGDRRVARLNPDGKTFTTVADRWEGKRFNSPNDLVIARGGAIFFTDPPYGLSPDTPREIAHHGVYRIDPDGSVHLITAELERPNGIALSPDERTLYVTNSHRPRPYIFAIALDASGNPVSEPYVLFDTRPFLIEGRNGLDGLAIDIHGNLWTTAPGGVFVITPDGRHLGSLLTGRSTANCTFGGPDGSQLYITADDTLVRLQTRTRGLAFSRQSGGKE